MYFIPALLFAFSANIDSLIIGVSYGIKRTLLPVSHCLLISLITFCGTAAALLLGGQILVLFPFSVTQWAGNLLLLGLGMYYVIKSIKDILKNRACTEKNSLREDGNIPALRRPPGQTQARALSARECVLLGAALSVNNLGIGVGASITGLPLLPAAPLSFVCSALFLFLGNQFGKCCSSCAGDSYADLLSGIILMILGIYEFL